MDNTKSRKTEIPLKQKCPCGRGKIYRNCCKKNNVIWSVDKNGKYFKSIPMSEEVMDILYDQIDLWKKIFEREPSGNEPMFLQKYIVSMRDMNREFKRAAQQVGVSEDLIYATNKTGLMPTNENWSLLTQKDIDDWKQVIGEYHQNANEPPDEFEEVFSSLCEEFESCIYSFGLIQDQYVNSKIRFTKKDNVLFIFFYITKAFKSLKTIYFLLKEELGEDTFSVIRSMYENYLHLIYLKSKPESTIDIIANFGGISLGSHEFLHTKTGKVDRRIIVSKDTGEKHKRLSNYNLIEVSELKEDVELFDYLYSYLSESVHPSFKYIENYIDSGIEKIEEDRIYIGHFDHQLCSQQNECRLYAIVVATIFLDEIRLLPKIPKKLKKDIETVINRIKNKFFAFQKFQNEKKLIVKIFSARMELIGLRN